MRKSLFITAVLSAFIGLNSCKQNESASSENKQDAEQIKTDGTTEEHKFATAPNVPAPIGSRAAKKVIVRLETIEKVGEQMGHSIISGRSTEQFQEASSVPE